MTVTKFSHIFVVGYGTMGKALADAWVRQGLIPPQELTIVSKHPVQPPYPSSVLAALEHASAPPSRASLLLLAVRPQSMAAVLSHLPVAFKSPQVTVGSVAAGLPLSFYEPFLAPQQSIVRFMPNLGVAVQEGVTAGIANGDLSPAQRQAIAHLFDSCGTYFWVEQEAALNYVTALFGSGPGYVFYLADIMAKIAQQKLHLPPHLAQELSLRLLKGSVSYANSPPDRGDQGLFESLWADMARIKGTTHAGIEALRRNQQLEKIIDQAVEAAHTRAVELSKKIK